MADDTLYQGNRRYSSWSLRGWLAVRLAGLDVQDTVIPLQGGDTAAIKAVSPSGMVPYLVHQGAEIWDSLAIIEYCAEFYPALWPADSIARAHARAIAAEMHSGFRALRLAMPMNLMRSLPGIGQTPDSLADIARIEQIWHSTAARFGAGGPYLFGAELTGADIMFAPVCARFLIYQPPLSAGGLAYINAVRQHKLVAAWYDLAAAEPASWLVAKYEEIT